MMRSRWGRLASALSLLLATLLQCRAEAAGDAAVDATAATSEFDHFVTSCRVKYPHPMECVALVHIAQGLGMSPEPNSTDKSDLRKGGWLKVSCHTQLQICVLICALNLHYAQCVYMIVRWVFLTHAAIPRQIETPYCMWQGVRCSRVGKNRIVTNLE